MGHQYFFKIWINKWLIISLFISVKKYFYELIGLLRQKDILQHLYVCKLHLEILFFYRIAGYTLRQLVDSIRIDVDVMRARLIH